MKRLILHLGVHKTGTTHLQVVFSENRRSLMQNGVAYAKHAKFRNEVLEPMLQKKAGYDTTCIEYLDELWKRAETVLISDENLPGVINTLKSGAVYPDARKNLSRFLKLIKPEVSVQILVSVRNFADWIESVYLQSIRRRETVAFAQFIRKVNLESIAWPGLVNEIVKVAPNAAIVLWPYEWYRQNNDGLLDYLEGLLGPMPIRVDENIHPSYSEIALKILTAAEGAIREADRPRLQEFLRSNFTENQGYPRPKLFKPEIRKKLTQRYQADLDTIRKMAGPRFSVLGPASLF